MKKTLILGLMTLLLSGTVRAQWIVSDPENTYQGVLSVQQLKNTVSSLREQKKILDESLDYMRKVNATVSNSMTVKYLIERQLKLSTECGKLLGRAGKSGMKSSTLSSLTSCVGPDREQQRTADQPCEKRSFDLTEDERCGEAGTSQGYRETDRTG